MEIDRILELSLAIFGSGKLLHEVWEVCHWCYHFWKHWRSR